MVEEHDQSGGAGMVMNSSEKSAPEDLAPGSDCGERTLAQRTALLESSLDQPALQNDSQSYIPGSQPPESRLPNNLTPAISRVPDVAGSLQSLLGTVVIAVFVITFIVQAFQIPSPSMESTLLVGDYLLVNKFCYGGGGLSDYFMPYRRVRRGDVVVFHYPVNPAQHFVKRVIGVPGDRIRLINKQVYVNGVAQKEPYAHFSRPLNDLFRDNFPRLDVAAGETAEWWLQLRKLFDNGQLIVPQDRYFVMGDNRDDSYDSRYWGFVPRANIIGRPLLIYWSVKEAEDDSLSPTSVSGKLTHLAYSITHILQITRWDRTLRVVN